MAMAVAGGSGLYRRTRVQVDWLDLRVGGQSALSLHSSNEPGELP